MLNSLEPSVAESLRDWATYIVVGAGAAGSVVAARLAEDPANNVLVLELGPNNHGNKFIETPADNNLLWEHPDGPRPSPTSLSFRTSTQLGRRYTYPRGAGDGGSSNHHSMVDGRGSAQIYDKIAELVGDPRWSYRQILPYYKKMESFHVPFTDRRFHGMDGWLQIKQLTMKAPLHADVLQGAHEVTEAPIRNDMSGPPDQADGVGRADLQISSNGKRSSAFENLVLPHLKQSAQSRGRRNLLVICNTLVTRVLLKAEPGHSARYQATGVKAIHQTHAYLADQSAPVGDAHSAQPLIVQFNARREVILCGGAINTPQLLMLSGIGPRQHLQDLDIQVKLDSPGVGSDLMDHHEVNVLWEVDSRKMVWPAQAAGIIDSIDAYVENQQEPLSEDDLEVFRSLREHMAQFADRTEQREGGGSVMLDWFSGMPTDIGHDLHIDIGEGFMYDFDLSSPQPLPDGRLRTDYLRSQYDLWHPDFLRVFHHALIEALKPSQANGTIRLASADPTVPPIVDLGLWKDDEAAERMARGIQMVRKIARHPSVKRYYKLDSQGEPVEVFPGAHVQTLEQLVQYLQRWSAFGHHISGTAKMGRLDNPRAVVDTRLRVLGVPNLRVIDTSIYPFPYLHGYNTSRGAYLVGEMGADFIKEAHC